MSPKRLLDGVPFPEFLSEIHTAYLLSGEEKMKDLWNAEIAIPYRKIWLMAYGLLILPIIIFFLGWLWWGYGLVFSSILLVGFKFVVKDLKSKRVLRLKWSYLLLILGIILLWCILCGQGGFCAQKWDHHFRNATFHDLVNYDWPVIYENNSALVYYLGYWLVPALFGKLGFLFGDEAVAWKFANVALLLWSTLNLTTLVLLIMTAFRIRTQTLKSLGMILGILLFFSGMDILAWVRIALYAGEFYFQPHLEWWALWRENKIQYPSNTMLLAWVFNQAIPAWLGTTLLYTNSRVRNFAFIGLLLLPYSGFVFLGFVLISVFIGFYYAFIWLKNRRVGLLFREVFSIQNLCATISILTVFVFYYSNAPSMSDSRLGLFITAENYQDLFFFCFIEFLTLAILLFRYNYRNVWFYGMLFSLFFFVCTKFVSSDYNGRASIPALFLLMLFCVRFFILDYPSAGRYPRALLARLTFYAILFCLCAGSVTGFRELQVSLMSTYDCITTGKPVAADDFGTCGEVEKHELLNRNYVAKNVGENIFYKYLARTKMPTGAILKTEAESHRKAVKPRRKPVGKSPESCETPSETCRKVTGKL